MFHKIKRPLKLSHPTIHAQIYNIPIFNLLTHLPLMRAVLKIIIILIFIPKGTIGQLDLVYSEDICLRVPIGIDNARNKSTQEELSKPEYPYWLENYSEWIAEHEWTEWLSQARIYAGKIVDYNVSRFIKSLNNIKSWLEEGEVEVIDSESIREDVDIYLYPDPDVWPKEYWKIVNEIRNSDLTDIEKVAFGIYISQETNFMANIKKVSPEDLNKLLTVMDELELEKIEHKLPRFYKMFDVDIYKIKSQLQFFSKHRLTVGQMEIVKEKIDIFIDDVVPIARDIKSWLAKKESDDKEWEGILFESFYHYSVYIGYILAIANAGFPFTESMVEELRELDRVLKDNNFVAAANVSKYKKLIDSTKFVLDTLLKGLEKTTQIYVRGKNIDLIQIWKAYIKTGSSI